MAPWILLLALVPLPLFMLLNKRRLDQRRIARDLRRTAAKLLDCAGPPFRRRWYAGRDGRPYEVLFVDVQGRQQRGWCVTNAFIGVRWVKDSSIIDSPAWNYPFHRPR